MNRIGVFKDFNDNSIKSIYEINNKIIEMNLVKNKEYEDIVCVPTHYFSSEGNNIVRLPECDIFNLENIRINDFIKCFVCSLREQNTNSKRTNNKELCIKFNGIGDPLLNIKLIEDVFKSESIFKEELGYDSIRYIISTNIHDLNLFNQLESIINKYKVCSSIEFNLLSCDDLVRKDLITYSKSSLRDILDELGFNYSNICVNYMLIKGLNDSLKDFKKLVNVISTYGFKLSLSNYLYNNLFISDMLSVWSELLKNTNIEVIDNNYGKDIDINYTKYFYLNEVSNSDKESFDKWKRSHQLFESQRRDNLSWDEYFMCVAKLTAMRSKDPNTQVGAVIVSKDNRILSIGYNGSPNGYEDERFPWKREGSKLDTKYLFVVHAERNAILNYLGNRKDFVGARIYVDLFPCNECAKEIIQSGIEEVIYLSDKYKDTEETIASKRLFDACGVSYRQFSDDKVITLKLNK